jgi:hypothetical protein
MFKHTVIIIRPDASNPFFYDYDNTLSKLEYINMTDIAKSEGKLLEENYVISPDSLILQRTVIWDTEQSFIDFVSKWDSLFPTHRSDLQAYSENHGHYAVLMTE